MPDPKSRWSVLKHIDQDHLKLISHSTNHNQWNFKTLAHMLHQLCDMRTRNFTTFKGE